MSVLDVLKKLQQGPSIAPQMANGTQSFGAAAGAVAGASRLPIQMNNTNVLQHAPGIPMSRTYAPQLPLYDHQAVQGNSTPNSLQGAPFNQTAPQVGPTYYNLHQLAIQGQGEHGAMPPNMVNVPWSSHQVPYDQSLNPPASYANQQMSRNKGRAEIMVTR